MSYLWRVPKAHQILHNLEARLNYQLSVSSLGCTLRQRIRQLTTGANCGILERIWELRSAMCITENSHVSTQHYLVVGEATLWVHRPKGTYTIDNEAVIGDWRLEPLQSVPLNEMSGWYTLASPVTHKSYYKWFLLVEGINVTARTHLLLNHNSGSKAWCHISET